MAKTLDQVVGKWTANASGAQQAFVDGVQNTSVDPTQRAIANEAGLLSGFQQAVTSGRWRAALAAVGKAGWQAATVDKAGNYGTGIAAGKDKYSASMSQWLPILQSVGATAKGMPGATIDQRIARSAYVAKTLYNRKRGL
jgi:hypothetical protein